ncbi:hypothetical protein [Polaribacter sp. Hel1_85]|uniref:hypothetical protein n=1 Tax=Polaribacter sp. Hel1_85 TaxID=1250005 RepID=UPI00052B6862|nr:hypothetical protein [Polaribacter sp. Hel1_85]KGL63323.1 hypothetical protein PHEL85_0357 [Polaribacter sp. Hel1_85]
MKKILEKIKLIDFLETELEIPKNEFTNRFSKIVDEGSTNSLFDMFDIFSSSKNEYKGEIEFSRFKIKRKKKFFDMNIIFPVAKGFLNQKDDKLFIKTEINAFKGIMIIFFVFIILIYLVIAISLFTNNNTDDFSIYLAIPFLLIHGSFMIGIPYLLLRRSVKRFKYEFERELFYLTKNN